LRRRRRSNDVFVDVDFGVAVFESRDEILFVDGVLDTVVSFFLFELKAITADFGVAARGEESFTASLAFSAPRP
jgi:hypothetical protein